MSVSVIIPTYNAKDLLADLLARLSFQSIPFELVIIDSSSTDGTAELAKEAADTFISIPKHTFDHGGTRTLAAKAAKGNLLVFLTQDALPIEQDTLETLLHAFHDPTVGAAFGRQIPYENTSLFGKHLRYFNYPKNSYTRAFTDKKHYGLKTTFFSDSFGAYRKSVLAEAGWFKNGLIVGEDMYVIANILMAGYKVAYQADAAVLHAHNYSLLEDFKRYFDTGVFHKRESWLIDTFGKAEGEGGRYIKSEFHFLLKEKAYQKIPEFIMRNGLKYLGYTFGKNYQHIPLKITKMLSMHPQWWQSNLPHPHEKN